ncbi:MAG: hypothetical protein ACNA8L_13915, partial [Luteolibacter sp.]
MSKRRKTGRNRKDSILHRDIKDLEITRSLKQLANIRVTDWELRELPHLRVTDWELKDIANYRVTEWDLKDLLGKRERSLRRQTTISPGEMRKLRDSLGRFVCFVAKSLIDNAERAEIKSNVTKPGTLEIKLVLTQRDAAALIGHGGHTAAAMRRTLKDIGRERGAHVT